MNEIPIFDSLTHPTINGDWILPKYRQCAKLSDLKQKMLNNNFKWAFAVGMENIGEYEEISYSKMFEISDGPILFPIAFFSPENGDFKVRLEKIRKLGYLGIKLHPRISNFTPNKGTVEIVKIASELGLIVLLCTYSYSGGLANKLTPELIMEFLDQLGSSKIILLHAGGVRLLEYMEIARAFQNVLLDLSLTICKYSGSSLDQDIRFLFHSFDRRICIGSDFPEFDQVALRERFAYFGQGLPSEKLENIAYSNLIKFCGLEKFV